MPRRQRLGGTRWLLASFDSDSFDSVRAECPSLRSWCVARRASSSSVRPSARLSSQLVVVSLARRGAFSSVPRRGFVVDHRHRVVRVRVVGRQPELPRRSSIARGHSSSPRAYKPFASPSFLAASSSTTRLRVRRGFFGRPAPGTVRSRREFPTAPACAAAVRTPRTRDSRRLQIRLVDVVALEQLGGAVFFFVLFVLRRFCRLCRRWALDVALLHPRERSSARNASRFFSFASLFLRAKISYGAGPSARSSFTERKTSSTPYASRRTSPRLRPRGILVLLVLGFVHVLERVRRAESRPDDRISSSSPSSSSLTSSSCSSSDVPTAAAPPRPRNRLSRPRRRRLIAPPAPTPASACQICCRRCLRSFWSTRPLPLAFSGKLRSRRRRWKTRDDRRLLDDFVA